MSDTLSINKSNALMAYNKADNNGKALLSNLFGEQVFQQKITDRVRSYEDACEVLGVQSNLSVADTTDETAYRKLKTICIALNEGWLPDWSDDDQYKYYPWFNMADGVSCFGYDCDCTGSHVSSRLCFKSRELAEYAGKQFLSIYKDFMAI